MVESGQIKGNLFKEKQLFSIKDIKYRIEKKKNRKEKDLLYDIVITLQINYKFIFLFYCFVKHGITKSYYMWLNKSIRDLINNID